MNNGKWTTNNSADQSDRIVIITGGNSGIGFETAKALASKNAHVILAVRNNEKGAEAVHQILKSYPRSVVEMRLLDLASLESIHKFVEKFSKDYDRLDLLVNNAGVMALPRRETQDGFEMQFGVNHLGHFALTGLILDKLLVTPASRVITVSSGLHERGKIIFDDLMGEQNYSKWGAYSQSKLANLLFAYELQRRLNQISAETISVAAHPGYAATNLQTAGAEMEGSNFSSMMMRLANTIFAQTAEMGALPTLYAALGDDVKGSDYIGPSGFQSMRGYPVKMQSSTASHDRQTAEQLWKISETLTGVQYDVLAQKSINVPAYA